MRKVTKASTWLIGSTIFLIVRAWTQKVALDSLVMGAVMAFLSMWWFIVPFVAGKDIRLPRFSNTILRKGEADLARVCFFALGVGMFCVSLLV